MLNSLLVQNYRNLPYLKIPSLSQVNLITGKNNSGKSSLLDAISIYACNANISWLVELLDDRKEFTNYSYSSSRGVLDESLFEKAVSCLFSNRQLKEAIIIGEIDGGFFNDNWATDKKIEIKPVQIVDEEIRQLNEVGKEVIFSKQRRVINNFDLNNAYFESRLGIEINSNKATSLFELRDINRHARYREIPSNVQYVHTQNIERESNSTLWDKIALTYKEKFIIEGLKIIEPAIERIAFVSISENINRLQRSPMVKLQSDDSIYPLKSMGDGINRILTILLSLVNCENGYLLIDEIENGLHYSVQRLLWEIIFDVAVKLNVQVFATTHSNDCIRAFAETLTESKSYSSLNDMNGQLLRLEQQYNGRVEAVAYSSYNLFSAIKFNIETR